MPKPVSISPNNNNKPPLTKLFKWFFTAKARWLKWTNAHRREKAVEAPLAKRAGYPRWKEVAVLQDETDIVTQRESSQMIAKASVRLPQ